MSTPVVSTAGIITADSQKAEFRPNVYVVEGNCLATIKAGTDEALKRSAWDFTMMLNDPEKGLTADAHSMALAIRDAINTELDSRHANPIK